MSDEVKLLQEVLRKLEKAKIAYMLVGGMAVSYWGEPRSTRDIDFSVAISQDNVPILKEAFEKGFSFSEEAIRQAILHRSEFNLIHPKTGLKVDFWILGKDEFRLQAFDRRQKVKIFGKDAFITSPEDLIISKLSWYHESESDKHLEDVKGILKVQDKKLDQSYLLEWITKLGLEREWEQVSGNL